MQECSKGSEDIEPTCIWLAPGGKMGIELVNVWINECMNEWVSDWVSASTSEQMTEYVKLGMGEK